MQYTTAHCRTHGNTRQQRSTLQHIAIHCNAVMNHFNVAFNLSMWGCVFLGNTLQWGKASPPCSLQCVRLWHIHEHTETRCNMLQYTTKRHFNTHCHALQWGDTSCSCGLECERFCFIWQLQHIAEHCNEMDFKWKRMITMPLTTNWTIMINVNSLCGILCLWIVADDISLKSRNAANGRTRNHSIELLGRYTN